MEVKHLNKFNFANLIANEINKEILANDTYEINLVDIIELIDEIEENDSIRKLLYVFEKLNLGFDEEKINSIINKIIYNYNLLKNEI